MRYSSKVGKEAIDLRENRHNTSVCQKTVPSKMCNKFLKLRDKRWARDLKVLQKRGCLEVWRDTLRKFSGIRHQNCRSWLTVAAMAEGKLMSKYTGGREGFQINECVFAALRKDKIVPALFEHHLASHPRRFMFSRWGEKWETADVSVKWGNEYETQYAFYQPVAMDS